MKRVLLDTNAYTSLLSGDESVLEVLATAEYCMMSVVVLGELHAGFKGGTKERMNRDLLEEFLCRSTVRTIDITAATAEIFGTVKNQLKQAGTPIPINDVWISAHAIETGSWLVSYDRHFSQVPGILLWDRSESA